MAVLIFVEENAGRGWGAIEESQMTITGAQVKAARELLGWADLAASVSESQRRRSATHDASPESANPSAAARPGLLEGIGFRDTRHELALAAYVK